MAVAWAEQLLPKQIEAYSAGLEAHKLSDSTAKVMAEKGMDICDTEMQQIDEMLGLDPDLVITLGGYAMVFYPPLPFSCPQLHARVYNPLSEERKLAKQGASSEELLNCYRQAREQIRQFIEALPKQLEKLEELKA